MTDIIYFELNTYLSGETYPPAAPFVEWVRSMQFSKNNWCIENQLCVVVEIINDTFNWCITATREWVEENCPDLLSNKTFTYKVPVTRYDIRINAEVQEFITYTGTYSKFLRTPDKLGRVTGTHGTIFKAYSEENWGVTQVNEITKE